MRVVSATNADLRSMVGEGSFREDLFFRINLIQLHIPALRERVEDIPLLAQHFAHKTKRNVTFADDALALLQSLPYPGNIRELKNLVERAILMSPDDTISARDLRPLISHAQPISQPQSGKTLEEIERSEIERQIALHNGNLSRVAKALGLSRAALYRRLEKYDL